MSTTATTLTAAEYSTLLQALRGEKEFNPFADDEYIARLERLEPKMLAALQRIRLRDQEIAASRRPRVRQP